MNRSKNPLLRNGWVEQNLCLKNGNIKKTGKKLYIIRDYHEVMLISIIIPLTLVVCRVAKKYD
jgi:hypothetical protein